MKNLIFTIIFIVPLTLVGQGLDLKLGSTSLIPFSKEYIFTSDYEQEVVTDLGFNSIVSYEFILEKINPKLFLSPSLSFTFLKRGVNTKAKNQQNEWFTIPENEFKDNYINFSTSVGYNLTKKISTSLGLTLDCIIKSKQISDIVDEDGNVININYELITNNIPIIIGLTSFIYVDYKLTDSFFIFSQLNSPTSIKNNNYYYRRGYEEDEYNFHIRRFLSVGFGYNIF